MNLRQIDDEPTYVERDNVVAVQAMDEDEWENIRTLVVLANGERIISTALAEDVEKALR